MSLFRLPLKSDVDPANAARVLGELIQSASSIGPSIGLEDLQNRYLDWAERAEFQLHYLTHDVDVLTMLDTARARTIRELRTDAIRPWPLVDAEVKLQVAVLDRMLNDLNARISRIATTDSHFVVVDTNILLHYKPLNELPWPEITGSEQVRVILPLRVIEELDQKKYAPRKDLASRTRRLLPKLRSWLGAAGAPAEIGKNVTLEVMLDTGPRWRPVDADEEILAACHELTQFGSPTLSLLSADTAMILRAQAEQIAVINLSEKYLRNPASE
jgi:PIN domain